MRRRVLSWGLTLLGVLAVVPSGAQEEELPPPAEPASTRTGDPGEYRTPLAGEPLETEVFGTKVSIPARDRGETFAINLGAAAFSPAVGDTSFTPIAAFYGKYYYDERRFRLVSSVFVNEFEFAEDYGGVESLFRLENYTIPVPNAELIDGQTLESTEVLWGRFGAWLGAGLRWKVHPNHVDNDLRLGLYYYLGYEYHERADETPDTVRVATDTYVHGLRLRLRLDSIQRNLLEMPHKGLAAGFDLELTRRDHWRDHGNPELRVFRRRDTRDYGKVSGYMVVALPIPLLSERHRFVGQIHAGYAPHDTLDRYSAFRLGGGPLPTESADLARSPFPGASFDQFPLEDYVVSTLEYRLELMFFLYLHFRVSYGIAKVPTRQDGPSGRLRFRRGEGYTATFALTTGFLWESQLYFEYDYDFRGTLRGDELGSTFMVLWSKSL